MQQTDVKFKKIYEHNMDLLIIEEFISDRGFARLFLDCLDITEDYRSCSVYHSLSDTDGESDITLVLEYPEQKIALLIEDKIDAKTMPAQSERYHKRGKKGIQRKEYDSYYVMIVAPSEYLEEHINDANADYDYRISYEMLREYLSKQNDVRSSFKVAMIDHAIREKKEGYQVQEVEAVTEFWRKLRQFCKEKYPRLDMLGTDAPKGASALWPEFRTSLGAVKVYYKSDKGYVDLEFPKYGDRTGELFLKVDGKISNQMQICRTGKSASIRIADERWKLDFSHEFNESENLVDEVLQAVSEFCDLTRQLNYSELY